MLFIMFIAKSNNNKSHLGKSTKSNLSEDIEGKLIPHICPSSDTIITNNLNCMVLKTWKGYIYKECMFYW